MQLDNRMKFANLPTPIQKIKFDGCFFYIKRDDLTGVEMSGNKVRKLEYLLYDAKKRKCGSLFTVGGDQSNHCRATAIAASSVGLKTKLFLWGRESKSADGNQFFYNLTNCDQVFLNKKEYENVKKIAAKEIQKYEKKGKKIYWIPEGGSSEVGIFGYAHFVNELKEQTNLKKFSGILTAAGTGGTAAGLLIGLALNNIQMKVYGVNVLYQEEILRNKIVEVTESAIKRFKLKIKINYKNLVILPGYDGGGYKNVSPESVNLSKRFFKETGILFDPIYTGKAFSAYHKLFVKSKKNSKVLFLHTGGLFGIFPKRRFYL